MTYSSVAFIRAKIRSGGCGGTERLLNARFVDFQFAALPPVFVPCGELIVATKIGLIW
jgi:hypothetical protein